MKTMMKRHSLTVRAAVLAVLVAPALSLAGDKGMDMSADARDAYREGQIWATYATNPGLNALDLSVDVKGDTAVISGTVETHIQKRLAARIADRAEGIATVDNRVSVDPEMIVAVVGPHPTFATFVADATLEAMVDSKLLWNHYTDGLDIDVKSVSGVITLTGTADTPHSRELAGRLAATTPGAILVHNRLELDAAQNGQVATAEAGEGDGVLSDTWITAKTKSMLQWTQGVQGADISVKTNDGVVSLAGTVESGLDKEIMIELAQGIRGVQRVDASGLKLRSTTAQVSQADANGVNGH